MIRFAGEQVGHRQQTEKAGHLQKWNRVEKHTQTHQLPVGGNRYLKRWPFRWWLRVSRGSKESVQWSTIWVFFKTIIGPFQQDGTGFCPFDLVVLGFYWVFTGFYRVWAGLTGFDMVLLGLTRFEQCLLGFTGFYWDLPGFTGFYWVKLGLTWFEWVLSGFNAFQRRWRDKISTGTTFVARLSPACSRATSEPPHADHCGSCRRFVFFFVSFSFLFFSFWDWKTNLAPFVFHFRFVFISCRPSVDRS